MLRNPDQHNSVKDLLEVLQCDIETDTVEDLKRKKEQAELLLSFLPGFGTLHPVQQARISAAFRRIDDFLGVAKREQAKKEAVIMARSVESRPRGSLQKVFANTSRDCGHWSFWVHGKVYELRFQPRPAGNSSERESSGVSHLNVTEEPVRSDFYNDLVGFTELPHEDIQQIAQGIIDARYTNYNIFVNNCQGYTRDLLNAILTHRIKTLTTTSTKVVFAVGLIVSLVALLAAFYWFSVSMESGLQDLRRAFNLDLKDVEIRMLGRFPPPPSSSAHRLPSPLHDDL